MTAAPPTIAVLGASGLIGQAVARSLAGDGFPVVPIARRFTAAQKAAFGAAAVESPVASLEAEGLARLFADNTIDIVVNCIGVLQDGPAGSTDIVHRAMVERLLAALAAGGAPRLLIHVSIPGSGEEDRTAFSRTKRQAERIIAAGTIPFVILRPGFVIAPAAYGGSALIRALATLPLVLPARESGRPVAATAVADIARTVAVVGRRWSDGERRWNAVWDVMAREPSTVGKLIDTFRRHYGGPRPLLTCPSVLLDVGAGLADLVSRLGWLPPTRSTALAEMRRGVTGDPAPWIAATGIEPISLEQAVGSLPAHVQEKWFARLYLAKALVLASLVVFWSVSGLIALTVAFAAATRILTQHGFPLTAARAVTFASSVVDILIGVGIAVRATCRRALIAGIAVSLFYMAGAAILTPALWIEPLGALVKTIPAIVLMLVALAILDDR
jgi:uncharacterized protein YbjT (DUF2867 family)